MSKPTLYLTNWSSKTQHGPGRKLCAMAKPRQWERGDGRVLAASPDALELEAVQRSRIPVEEYKMRCETRFEVAFLLNGIQPGRLMIFPSIPVVDGDSLLCACARPDSPARKHPCHLEWLAPFLVRAGWRVVLYGQEVSDG